MPHHDAVEARAQSPLTAFLLQGWRWTLLATLLGSLTVTAGVILTQGPLWVLGLDWALTLGYGGLIARHCLPGMRQDATPPCLSRPHAS